MPLYYLFILSMDSTLQKFGSVLVLLNAASCLQSSFSLVSWSLHCTNVRFLYIQSHSTTPAAIRIAVFLCYISTFLVQLEPGVPPRGFDQLCLEYEVLTDSSEGWMAFAVQ